MELRLKVNEEYRLRTFEKKMLRRIFLHKGPKVTKRWRHSRNEKFRNSSLIVLG